MTNKNKKMMNDDAMAGMMLNEPATSAKKKGGKGASKASGQTETCGCVIF